MRGNNERVPIHRMYELSQYQVCCLVIYSESSYNYETTMITRNVYILKLNIIKQLDK